MREELCIAFFGGFFGALCVTGFRYICYRIILWRARVEIISIFESCSADEKEFLLWLAIKGVEVFTPVNKVDERFGSRMLVNKIVEYMEMSPNKYFVMKEFVRETLRGRAIAKLRINSEWRYDGSLGGIR